MKLVPVQLRKGQGVVCSECGKMSNAVKADLDAAPFTFLCALCEEDVQEPVGNTPKWRANERRILRNL